MRMAAIYARVSSEQQREEHTIASQTAALIEFARTHDLEVPKAWIFEDEGYSGATLERPGLERVRDLAALLTSNHGHTAMFGVFGMLALAVLVFCLRAMQTDPVWEGTVKLVRVGFLGLNAGLALMVVTDLFPGGVLQLWDSLSHGYWHARRLTYLMSGTFHTLEWVRIFADSVFLTLGVVPILIAAVRSLGKRDGPRASEAA